MVERAGQPVAIGGPQRRAVLSLLVLHVNEVVSLDRLADAVWGDSPPRSFRVQVQTAVSKLRMALGESGKPATAPIETHDSGYCLRLSTEQMDVAWFHQEVAAARREIEADDLAAAAGLLRRALARWYGRAFDGVPYQPVEQAAAALEEVRLDALADRIDADIAMGSYQAPIAELWSLIGNHPELERFRGQLMRALARARRFADALAVYRDAREYAVTELGLEPSLQLQQLHRAILMGLTEPDLAPAVSAQPYVVPRQLPADVSDLVGREESLEWLLDVLGGKRNRVAITGPGGSGKTALALRVAHRLRSAFPEGQLYARLGGGRSAPLSAEAVQRQFLHALGVPPSGVPLGSDERTALYRELLNTRRVLIVLEDVTEEAQVRPLLPAEPRCAVLITSRRRLLGLETVMQLPLDMLCVEAGVELLRAVAGNRIETEAEAAADVVRHCGGLPLAIRLAGSRLASGTVWSVSDFAERLRPRRDRLDWLHLGDTCVKASLTETYLALGRRQQQLFRRLGLLRSTEFPGWLAAALLDERTSKAERVLNDLVDAHLVEFAERGVTGPLYRMHDLVHLFAVELIENESPETTKMAFRRVLGGWLDLAATADDALPHWYGRDPEPPPDWQAPVEVHRAVRARPLAWFDEASSTLVELVGQAGEQANVRFAWPLAQRLTTYLDMRGRYDEWADILRQGLNAAEKAGDRAGIACMFGLLTDVEADRDSLGVSLQYAQQALTVYRTLGVEPAEQLTAPPATPPHSPEITAVEEELAKARAVGDALAVGKSAHMLATARRDAGHRADYLSLFEEARCAFRSCGAQLAELWTLKNIGLAYLKLRQFDDAEECLRQGQSIIDRVGDSVSLADCTADIAMAYVREGRYAEAEIVARTALERARFHGHGWDEGRALDTLAQLCSSRGDLQVALDIHHEALAVWRRLGVTQRISRTMEALADLCVRVGDVAASELYREECPPFHEQ